jgi:hypothetical protein
MASSRAILGLRAWLVRTEPCEADGRRIVMPAARDPSVPRRRRRKLGWRRRVGWPAVALGALLAIYGYVGATTGAIVLPFDRHHVMSELGGLVLVVLGLRWATWRQ